jgi:hypothetical protein
MDPLADAIRAKLGWTAHTPELDEVVTLES